MSYRIRALTPEDESILWEMLYQAVHGGTGPGEPPPPRDIIQKPELARYVEGWGRAGDVGFVATGASDDMPIGAAWLRLPVGEHKGYGYVDDETPELAFAVLPEHRRRGIGTALLTQLVTSNPEQSAISLSVAAGNPAVRLYERFGFKVVPHTGKGIVMRQDRGV